MALEFYQYGCAQYVPNKLKHEWKTINEYISFLFGIRNNPKIGNYERIVSCALVRIMTQTNDLIKNRIPEVPRTHLRLLLDHLREQEGFEVVEDNDKAGNMRFRYTYTDSQ